MTTKELDDKCHSLLDWMVKQPNNLVHIEDAERTLRGAREDWLTVFRHLTGQSLAIGSYRDTLIKLTPTGTDVAQQAGGYLAYVTLKETEKQEETSRKKRTDTAAQVSAWIAFFSLLATIGIAAWQSNQNSDTTSKIMLLEARQNNLTDSLKNIYKISRLSNRLLSMPTGVAPNKKDSIISVKPAVLPKHK